MSDLHLRPIEPEDVATIAAFLAHPSLDGRRGLDRERTNQSSASLTKAIEGMIEPELGATWVAEADGVVGVVRADWWWDALSPWIHVVIDPQHQRQGHGTGAVRQALDHLFLNTPAMVIQGGVPSWDEAGLAFAAALGALEVGRKRRAGVRDGVYFDQVEFVVQRVDWEGDRAARR